MAYSKAKLQYQKFKQTVISYL